MTRQQIEEIKSILWSKFRLCLPLHHSVAMGESGTRIEDTVMWTIDAATYVQYSFDLKNGALVVNGFYGDNIHVIDYTELQKIWNING